jgi:hypothetical protein
MPMPRPYPPEFRRRALDLVESGRTVRDVAASLGIAESCLYRWRCCRSAAGQAGWSAVCQAEVQGVVDGGFGAQGLSLLVALLDLGVLVEQVQARGDLASNDEGGEGAGVWSLRSR